MQLQMAYLSYSDHAVYEHAMCQVEAKRSDMISDLALIAGIKFAAAKQWVADHMLPYQTFDEALDAAHSFNTIQAHHAMRQATQ